MRSDGTNFETFNAVIEEEPLRPEEPPPGHYVGLAVRDTGAGIPDDVLPRVFEPFYSTKEPGKGSGLGLAQVFGFTKQSGGGVRIETCVGQGTSVTVFFPRAEMLAADELGKAGAGGQASQTQENACILVVDDDGIVLKSTLRVLNSLGYAALPARSGEEALRLSLTNLRSISFSRTSPCRKRMAPNSQEPSTSNGRLCRSSSSPAMAMSTC